MKILITIGMVIVFISAFFIILIGDSIFNTAFECADDSGRVVCQYIGMTGSHTISLFMIAFFIVIDFLTVYIIVKNITGTQRL